MTGGRGAIVVPKGRTGQLERNYRSLLDLCDALEAIADSLPHPDARLCLATADALEGQGIGADVVTMPCWSLFDAQDADYRTDLLPADALKVSVEAGTTLGWERYADLSIGLDRFGASAPAEDLFKRFGFTAEAIVPRILAALNAQGD